MKDYIKIVSRRISGSSHANSKPAETNTNGPAQEKRAQAAQKWAKGHHSTALRLYREAIREYPKDSLLWMSFAQRLQQSNRYDLAYYAYTNSVEIDPGNFEALEHFIEMAADRNDTGLTSRVLSGLKFSIESRQNRHRRSLDFAIPYKLVEVLDYVAMFTDDEVARAVVQLQNTNGDAELNNLNETQIAKAHSIFSLARGRRSDALNSMAQLTPEEIPMESLRLAIRRDLRRGKNKGAEKLLREYLRVRPEDAWAKSKIKSFNVLSDYQLTVKGFPFPAKNGEPFYEARVDRISYLLHNSLPYNSAGYATRTHGLLSALKRLDWDIEGVTRLGYPFDMSKHQGLKEIPETDVIDNVPYTRLSTVSTDQPKKPIQMYTKRYVSAFMEYAKIRRPRIIHAASNHWNGLAAVSAGNRLGIPSIYEVRGLWEVTRGSRDPNWAEGGMFRYMAKMESEAAKNATKVIAITQALKDELINRGVDGEKISIVPNGVDTNRFIPVEPNRELAEKLGIQGKTVIGYIGSILDYEGLGLLIEAAIRLGSRRDDFVVLLVGDGAELDRFNAEIHESGYEHLFRVTGRVPHSEVEQYYSLVNIAPFPRLPLPVCEMVSPLKPFEAMAMGKAVVASDVAALAEIVEDGENGLLHVKGDVSSLEAQLETLLDSPSLVAALGARAREWVVNERDWNTLARQIDSIYKQL